jgi:hypothetical protein
MLLREFNEKDLIARYIRKLSSLAFKVDFSYVLTTYGASEYRNTRIYA